MNMFGIGVFVGIGLFCLIYTVFTLNKLQSGMILVLQRLEANAKALQLVFLKVNKIEKTSQTTMNAAETFVDALRESAEQMMMRPPNMRKMGEGKEEFDDLRKAFDEGIRQMEENDEEDDREDDSEENWKQ